MPPELASWVQAQRSKFRSGILEEERAQLLLALGCKMKINETAKWEDRFEQLKDFIAQNGRFPENADTFNNSSVKTLLTWVNSQRKAHLNGKLSEEKIKKLEDIGFVWNLNDVQWNKNFEVLKEFVEVNGRLPTTRKSKIACRYWSYEIRWLHSRFKVIIFTRRYNFKYICGLFCYMV